MIKNITGNSAYLTVVGGMTNGPYINLQGVGAGNLRWNPSSYSMEVYDGYMWHPMGAPDAYLDLAPEVKDLLGWVRQQRDRERELDRLVETNPELARARDAMTRAQNNFELLARLALSQPGTDNDEYTV